MIKHMTCIECPLSCALTVDLEGCRVVSVKGHKCPRGEGYAVSEVEHPTRTLTSAVLADGLSLKMIPVRTDTPIPKSKMTEAMSAIRKIRIKKPLRAGAVIESNFLGLGVRLIATRDAA